MLKESEGLITDSFSQLVYRCPRTAERAQRMLWSLPQQVLQLLVSVFQISLVNSIPLSEIKVWILLVIWQ